MFIIPTAVLLLCVYFFFPETKQRSLEDINAAFGEKVAVHYYNATTEEEEEYIKATNLKELARDNPGVDSRSGKEKESGVLHSENV